MQLLGTIVNTAAIIGGTLIGFILRKGIPERMNKTIMQGLALGIMVLGLSEGIKSTNPIIVFGCVVLGGILGEFMGIEKRLEDFGHQFQKLLKNKGGNVAQAFVTTSLIFCIGAMAIMGPIQSGLQNDHTTLYAKSIIDGVSAIIFSSTLGIGVILSGISVFLYQGSITLLASVIKPLLSDPVIREMSAIGGVLIFGIGINMLDIVKIRLGNLLPAVFLPIILYMIHPFS